MRYHLFIFFLFACVMMSSCNSDNDEAASAANTGNNAYEGINPDDDYEYELPVIFHVLYKDVSDASQYISASRLGEILNHVNELYVGGIYGESEDIKVKFVLAETDEDGNALSTPGVEYVKYSGSYPIDAYDFMNDASGHSGNWKYIWEPNDYINVMMYNFSQDDDDEGVMLGISHMPYYAGSLPDIDGLTKNSKTYLTKDNIKFPYCVSINSLYAAKNKDDRYSDAKDPYYYSTDVIATLAHELGHYLGLYHVFTEVDDDEEACEDTDYCDDTETYNKYKYDEWATATIKAATDKDPLTLSKLAQREPCDGESYQSTNILDYAYSYSYAFTQDQAYRMRQVLYYSPLMPGPKKESTSSDTRSADGLVDLPIRIAK